MTDDWPDEYDEESSDNDGPGLLDAFAFIEENVEDYHHEGHDGMDKDSPRYDADLRWLSRLSYWARLVEVLSDQTLLDWL